ncbi:MAG TPA: hypothetical protein VIG33_09840 [Pseudobdellovibrionaceae bacterium]|jgi:hypothetical protein
MSLIIFFGGVSVVVLIAIGVVVHGVYHHAQEAQKLKLDKKDSL